MKGSYPLAYIDGIEVDPDGVSFKLLFPHNENPLHLQARSKDDCMEWLECIQEGKKTLFHKMSIMLCEVDTVGEKSSFIFTY